MKNNTNIYDPNYEYCNCCKQEVCVNERKTCASPHKEAWEEYLCNEKEEEGEAWELCDYDPNEIYFMQYRSKRAFYNEWWKKGLFKDIYNRNKHKYPGET